MSKITIDGLTRSARAGCFIAVPMATVGVKGLIAEEKTSAEKHGKSR